MLGYTRRSDPHYEVTAVLIERTEAMADLAPLLQLSPTVFRKALERTRNAPPLDLVDRTKTAGANLIRDYAVAEFTRAWASFPGIAMSYPHQQTLFVYQQKYAVRVKKLDHASCSRNYRTKADQSFRMQRQMEGMPLLIHLELGYVLNTEGTEVADTRLVCLNGARPYWWQSIENPQANVIDLFSADRGPLPAAPALEPKVPAEADTGVLITPKKV